MANYPIVDIGIPEALKAFAYKGKKGGFLGLNEDEIKSAMKSALEGHGYEVKVKWGRKPGPDIEAFSGRKLVLEAKGVWPLLPALERIWVAYLFRFAFLKRACGEHGRTMGLAFLFASDSRSAFRESLACRTDPSLSALGLVFHLR